MRSLFISLAFCALPLNAQFSNLVTTHDGSVLLFTSRLIQSGTDQPSHGKLFIVDSRGVRPLLVRERQVRYSIPGEWNLFPNGYTTNAYDLEAASTAGDLSQLAVTGTRECSGYTSGLCVSSHITTLYDANGAGTFATYGQMAVSRNGKWGHVKLDLLSGGTHVLIVDLRTMQEFRVFAPPVSTLVSPPSRQAIADDGTAVIATGDRLHIARPQRPIETIFLRASGAAIDAAGRTVVTSGQKLHLIRLDEVPLNPVELRSSAANPQMSADGKRILFHANGQACVIEPDGPTLRYVSAEPEGIRDEVLSGSGEVVWLVTNSGRLLQVFLNSGEKRELIGPVPAVLDLPSRSGNWWQVESAAAGQPLSVNTTVLTGEPLSARINGVPAPVLSAQRESVTIQVPWETPPGRHRIDLSGPRAAGWEGSVAQLTVRPVLPQFVTAPFGGPQPIAHEKFDALVTPSNPARAGEIVHVYALGFGPVVPPIATGQTTPRSPLSRTTLPLECSVFDDGRAVEIPFVGLAPGMIGIYQVDLRVPQVVAKETLSLRCNLPGWTAISGLTGALGSFNLSIPVQ